MPSRKTKRKVQPKARLIARPAAVMTVPAPVTNEITEKTSITTVPEVEMRRPATLSQALTERGEVVVKPKLVVQKRVLARKRRAA
jgi:hypothetical protein